MGIDKSYKLYAFDLDGTLVDTRVDIGRAFQEVLEEAGFARPNLEQVAAAIGRGSKEAVKKLTGLDDEALSPILDSFTTKYEQLCSDNTSVYEGGFQLVSKLKDQGAILALITMKFRIPTHKILHAHGLDMFDEVITFDDTDRRKPAPDSLNMILEKYNTRPSEAIMIGDTVNDMKFAHAAGVDACLMEYGYGHTCEVLALEPKYSLKSFLDF